MVMKENFYLYCLLLLLVKFMSYLDVALVMFIEFSRLDVHKQIPYLYRVQRANAFAKT